MANARGACLPIWKLGVDLCSSRPSGRSVPRRVSGDESEREIWLRVSVDLHTWGGPAGLERVLRGGGGGGVELPILLAPSRGGRAEGLGNCACVLSSEKALYMREVGWVEYQVLISPVGDRRLLEDSSESRHLPGKERPGRLNGSRPRCLERPEQSPD